MEEAYVLEVIDYTENDAYIGGLCTNFARAAELMWLRVCELGGEIEQIFLVNSHVLAEAVVWDGIEILLRCRIVKQMI